MDPLDLLLQRSSLSAGFFYAGQMCGIHQFDHDPQQGHSHVHIVKRGPVTLAGGPESPVTLTVPSLVFLPRPITHRLIADERAGADVVCASVQFGVGLRNPITDSLPALVCVPLADLEGAQALLDLLFGEAFASHCGRQAALNRLCELLLIQLLRHCLARGLTAGGVLAGLADPRLAKTLMALHQNAARPWELVDMAEVAGMSRARFAVHFREVVGETPADYLASWRVALAQGLLRAGKSLTHVAADVGYGSPSALTRAFIRKTGQAPTHWLREVEAAATLGD